MFKKKSHRKIRHANAKKTNKFLSWCKKHHTATIALAGIGLIVCGGVVVFALTYQKPQKDIIVDTPKKIKKPAPKPVEKFYAPLTGLEVKEKNDESKPVTAIMLENSPAARPQSGLKDAETVYEAVAEGGITRFLAFYQQNKPDLIGPVRSLRMYYVDWLTPYDASVAHIGGSADALRKVRDGSYKDIDQFFNSQAYWRSRDRYAPHNVYTNFEKLDLLNSRKGFVTSNPKVPTRIKGEKATRPNGETANQVRVNISSYVFNSQYSYNSETKSYARSQGGAPHVDREKGQINADVVVVLRVDMHRVMLDGWREEIKTVGEGEAIVFEQGVAYKLKWRKKDVASPIEFLTSDDKEFKLANGKLWITALPSTGSVSWD